jgi:hypothetical protein
LEKDREVATDKFGIINVREDRVKFLAESLPSGREFLVKSKENLI